VILRLGGLGGPLLPNGSIEMRGLADARAGGSDPDQPAAARRGRSGERQTGTGARSVAATRGDRDRSRKSWGPRAKSSGSSRPRSCAAGAKPRLQSLRKQQALVTQGKPGSELYLLLDGVLEVDVDGRRLGQLGPGAIVGERAAVDGGLRTATLRAVTDCRVAVVIADQIDPAAVSGLTELHGRKKRPDRLYPTVTRGWRERPLLERRER